MYALHVCHGHGDWTIFIGLPLQQDTGISLVPPHPDALCQKTRSQQVLTDTSVPKQWRELELESYWFDACLRPARKLFFTI